MSASAPSSDCRPACAAPAEAELPARLHPVLAVVYLTYNAGTSGPAGDGLRQHWLEVLVVQRSRVGDRLAVTALPATEFSAWRLRPDMSDTLVVAGTGAGPTGLDTGGVPLAGASTYAA